MSQELAEKIKIFDKNCQDITGVSQGLIESLTFNFDKILAKKGLVHILNLINISLSKSSFYERKTQGYKNPKLRSRFDNLKSEYYNYAKNISVKFGNLEITSLVFLNHQETKKIITEI